MSTDLQQTTLKTKTDRGRWQVLGLMAMYLILATAVGAARSQLPNSGAAMAAPVAAQPAPPAG